MQQLGVTAAAPLLLPGLSRGTAANSKLHIAGIGVGGKGYSDIQEVSKGQNLVAICDIDETHLARAAEMFPGARTYTDWRRLLEQKDIDAVTVSTPDHMHAPITMAAMALGKHVYCQKPLTHSVHEARQLTQASRRYGVVTQMGIQNHSAIRIRKAMKIFRQGPIGKVREIHAWTDRPTGYWPQPAMRPTQGQASPGTVHWDHWLGVAPDRPYVKQVYHPFNWRGWRDFGTGALGDMACHILDPVMWAINPGPPQAIWSEGPAPSAESFPPWSIIHFEFPGNEHSGGDPIHLMWYDGKKLPPKEIQRFPDGLSSPDNGAILIGENGNLLLFGAGPFLLPVENFTDYEYPTVEAENHYTEWTAACLNRTSASTPIDTFSGPLTETILLGNVALHFPHVRLEWDSKSFRFTNFPDANQYLRRPYREGWEMEGL